MVDDRHEALGQAVEPVPIGQHALVQFRVLSPVDARVVRLCRRSAIQDVLRPQPDLPPPVPHVALDVHPGVMLRLSDPIGRDRTEVHEAPDDIRARGCEHCQHPLQVAGGPLVIAVQERDVLTLGMFQADVAGVGLALVRGQSDVLELAAEVPAEPQRLAPGVVRAAIVNHDDLDVTDGLGEG